MNHNLAYQDELREELIDGKFVAMSPRPSYNHNQIASNIFRIFGNYLDGRSCTAIADGMDLYLTDDDHFIPDIMIVCDRNKIKSDGVYGAPDLVVEVLSPSTAKRDRIYKKEVYERCGVREYWLVNPTDRSVEIYLNKDGVLTPEEVYTTHPDWMLARMTEEERAAVVTQFRCSLYDDLDISMEAIFKELLPES